MMLLQFKYWFSAFRVRTLPAALSPVFIGAILSESVHLLTFSLIIIVAVLIQIGTNLANDYFDYKNGADTEERLGPIRATSAGLITPQAMLRGVIVTFLLAFFIGLSLVYRGGLPILIIGVLSIISGIAYTGGPYPLGYNGLGDLFVLIFFGPIAVAGTSYLFDLQFSADIAFLGLGPGLLSMAILAVNNLRDCKEDKKTGKRTLAVRFGASFAKWEYVFSIVMASSLPIIWSLYRGLFELKMLLILFSLVMAIPNIYKVFTQSGQVLNMVLANTGKLMLVYTVLLYLIFK